MAKAKAKPTKKPVKKPAAKKPAMKKSAVKKPAKPAGMQLQLESGKLIRNVKVEQLQQAIAGEEFAILGGGPKSSTYIQTAVQDKPPYRYILEYQEGSIAEHYGAVHDGIELAEIVTAFSKISSRRCVVAHRLHVGANEALRLLAPPVCARLHRCFVGVT